MYRPLQRHFCAIASDKIPTGLRESKHVSFRLQSAKDQLKPSASRRGEKAIGIGDRGAGLVYRDGRPASSAAMDEKTMQTHDGVWVVKIQPPLDVSSDSAGGIGRITPATLLLSNRTWSFARFVTEDEVHAHFPLLRCALSEDSQVAYRYAEQYSEDGPMLKVYTELKPPREVIGW